MNIDGEVPLDISEFRCLAVRPTGVVVVFEQTNRRYTFPWHDGELALREPAIEGACGPHAAEVIDCLARAVAHHAARAMVVADTGGPVAAPPRTLRTQLRDFLMMRG